MRTSWLGIPRFSLMALVQRNPIGEHVGLFCRGVKIDGTFTGHMSFLDNNNT
jgi:hypothetical protein